jgi:hypothetical protein
VVISTLAAYPDAATKTNTNAAGLAEIDRLMVAIDAGPVGDRAGMSLKVQPRLPCPVRVNCRTEEAGDERLVWA